MLVPPFEPTPQWWLEYAQFVYGLGTLDNQFIQHSVEQARQEVTRAGRASMLQLLELALRDTATFVSRAQEVQGERKRKVAEEMIMVMAVLPDTLRAKHAPLLNAAAQHMQLMYPSLANTGLTLQVMQSLVNPDALASAAVAPTAAFAEARALARMVVKQDLVTALVQAGIVTATDVNDVRVEALLTEYSTLLAGLDSRIQDSVQDLPGEVTDTLMRHATAGALRADSGARAQRVELGMLAGLRSTPAFPTTLFQLSAFVNQSTTLLPKLMLPDPLNSVQGTCNYDTYLLPSIASAFYKKAAKATPGLTAVLNITGACTRFPSLFFAARAQSGELSETVVRDALLTYLTDVTLRFQLFDNYVSQHARATDDKFYTMTPVQLKLWFLLYETRRVNTLLVMHLLTSLYPSVYTKAVVKQTVVRVQKTVGDALQLCARQCNDFCVKVSSASGLKECLGRLADTEHTDMVPLLQTTTEYSDAQYQQQFSVRHILDTPAYQHEQPAKPVDAETCVDMLTVMFVPSLIGWSLSAIRNLDADSKVRSAVERIVTELNVSVPANAKQASEAYTEAQVRQDMREHIGVMQPALTFVTECRQTWRRIVYEQAAERAVDIEHYTYSAQLWLGQLREQNPQVYKLVENTLSTLWKMLRVPYSNLVVPLGPDSDTAMPHGLVAIKTVDASVEMQVFGLMTSTLLLLARRLVMYSRHVAGVGGARNTTFGSFIVSSLQLVTAKMVNTLAEGTVKALSPARWLYILEQLERAFPAGTGRVKNMYGALAQVDFKAVLPTPTLPSLPLQSLSKNLKALFVTNPVAQTAMVLASLWLLKQVPANISTASPAAGAESVEHVLPVVQQLLVNSSTLKTTVTDFPETLGVLKTLATLADPQTTLDSTQAAQMLESALSKSSAINIEVELPQIVTAICNATLSETVQASMDTQSFSLPLPPVLVQAFGPELATNVKALIAPVPPPVQAAIAPPPVQAAIAPPPVQAAIAPPPVQAAIAPPPVQAAIAPPPVQAAIAPPPVQASIAPPPVQAAIAPPAPPVDLDNTFPLRPLMHPGDMIDNLAEFVATTSCVPLPTPLDMEHSLPPLLPHNDLNATFGAIDSDSLLTTWETNVPSGNLLANTTTTVYDRNPADLQACALAVGGLAVAGVGYYVVKKYKLGDKLKQYTTQGGRALAGLIQKGSPRFGLVGAEKQVEETEATLQQALASEKAVTEETKRWDADRKQRKRQVYWARLLQKLRNTSRQQLEALKRLQEEGDTPVIQAEIQVVTRRINDFDAETGQIVDELQSSLSTERLEIENVVEELVAVEDVANDTLRSAVAAEVVQASIAATSARVAQLATKSVSSQVVDWQTFLHDKQECVKALNDVRAAILNIHFLRSDKFNALQQMWADALPLALPGKRSAADAQRLASLFRDTQLFASYLISVLLPEKTSRLSRATVEAATARRDLGELHELVSTVSQVRHTFERQQMLETQLSEAAQQVDEYQEQVDALTLLQGVLGQHLHALVNECLVMSQPPVPVKVPVPAGVISPDVDAELSERVARSLDAFTEAISKHVSPPPAGIDLASLTFDQAVVDNQISAFMRVSGLSDEPQLGVVCFALLAQPAGVAAVPLLCALWRWTKQKTETWGALINATPQVPVSAQITHAMQMLNYLESANVIGLVLMRGQLNALTNCPPTRATTREYERTSADVRSSLYHHYFCLALDALDQNANDALLATAVWFAVRAFTFSEAVEVVVRGAALPYGTKVLLLGIFALGSQEDDVEFLTAYRARVLESLPAEQRDLIAKQMQTDAQMKLELATAFEQAAQAASAGQEDRDSAQAQVSEAEADVEAAKLLVAQRLQSRFRLVKQKAQAERQRQEEFQKLARVQALYRGYRSRQLQQPVKRIENAVTAVRNLLEETQLDMPYENVYERVDESLYDLEVLQRDIERLPADRADIAAAKLHLRQSVLHARDKATALLLDKLRELKVPDKKLQGELLEILDTLIDDWESRGLPTGGIRSLKDEVIVLSKEARKAAESLPPPVISFQEAMAVAERQFLSISPTDSWNTIIAQTRDILATLAALPSAEKEYDTPGSEFGRNMRQLEAKIHDLIMTKLQEGKNKVQRQIQKQKREAALLTRQTLQEQMKQAVEMGVDSPTINALNRDLEKLVSPLLVPPKQPAQPSQSQARQVNALMDRYVTNVNQVAERVEQLEKVAEQRTWEELVATARGFMVLLKPPPGLLMYKPAERRKEVLKRANLLRADMEGILRLQLNPIDRVFKDQVLKFIVLADSELPREVVYQGRRMNKIEANRLIRRTWRTMEDKSRLVALVTNLISEPSVELRRVGARVQALGEEVLQKNADIAAAIPRFLTPASMSGGHVIKRRQRTRVMRLKQRA